MNLPYDAEKLTSEPTFILPYVDYPNVKKAALILRSLNNNLRQTIVKALLENKRLTVTQLYIKLRLEQSVASQHLGILRRANVVTTERYKKSIFYSINQAQLAAITEFSKNLNNLTSKSNRS